MTNVNGNFSTFDKLRNNKHETKYETNTNITHPVSVSTDSIADSFSKEKRKNSGLIERLYNKVKNITGLGVGTKKVEAVIADVKKW